MTLTRWLLLFWKRLKVTQEQEVLAAGRPTADRTLRRDERGQVGRSVGWH